ncbi:MAG: hypothetical protein SFV55_24780 [Haliscomenobacter sp.]|uniref:hypothetical protein n=1 Tax=Haliscomenobacter sp. TaxID=2717303 RepID=UPI0029BEDE18|nr:hypothetical protein [Haliscomenobacter sp.]MDX2071670.1 hypothetical protein [Haliscomenobacter sp.]
MKPLFTSLILILVGQLFAQNPDINRLPDTSFQTEQIKTASWTISTTFNSRVLSAGRDFGTSQFGLFPGVFYSHPTGLYAGLSGSIYGDSALLSYTQTNLSLGFAGSFTSNWRYGFSFAHTFFNPAEEGLLSNGIGLSTDLTFGAFNIGTSFTAMLGEENGYRLNLFSSGYWPLGQKGFLGNCALAPSLSGLFGTENIPFYTLPLTQFERTSGVRWAERKKKLPTPNPRPRQESSTNVFGLMSINLAVPLYYYAGNWTFSLSPNLVIPVPLPGETYTEEQTSSAFFSLSISRQF